MTWPRLGVLFLVLLAGLALIDASPDLHAASDPAAMARSYLVAGVLAGALVGAWGRS